jgi:hypothetical protein
MEWGDLGRTVISLGAPLLGEALGGPLGAAAGRILAKAVGAEDATPAAVNAALNGQGADRAAAEAAVLRAEAEFATALAEIGKTQVAEVGATQRAEMASDDPLQRWWRPIYALELSLVECPAFAFTLLHALWSGHDTGINGFASVSGLLMTYFGARFGVLGVYVSGRSKEKLAVATGGAVPGVVGEIVKAVTRRR